MNVYLLCGVGLCIVFVVWSGSLYRWALGLFCLFVCALWAQARVTQLARSGVVGFGCDDAAGFTGLPACYVYMCCCDKALQTCGCRCMQPCMIRVFFAYHTGMHAWRQACVFVSKSYNAFPHM